MKVILNVKSKVPFEELRAGRIFENCGEIFIKLPGDVFFENETVGYNAMEVHSGDLYRFRMDTEVNCFPDATLILEGVK